MKYLGIALILSIFVLLFVVVENFLTKQHPVYHKCMWIVQDSSEVNIDPQYHYLNYQVKCPHGYTQNYYAPANSFKMGQPIDFESDLNINQ